LPVCTHTVVVNGLAYLFKDQEATGIDVLPFLSWV